MNVVCATGCKFLQEDAWTTSACDGSPARDALCVSGQEVHPLPTGGRAQEAWRQGPKKL